MTYRNFQYTKHNVIKRLPNSVRRWNNNKITTARLTEQRRRFDVTHGKTGGCLGSAGFRALHASEPSFQFRHVERQVP